MNGVLAVGEPCAGDWTNRVWVCRCGAKSKEKCITETAVPQQTDLRYGDNCRLCRAASGIDTCPKGGGAGVCPLAVPKLPARYYAARTK